MYSQIIHQQNKFNIKDGLLYIDLVINIPIFNINENESIVLTPVLTEGEQKQELPCFLINGKQRHKGFKQMVRSIGKSSVYSFYNIHKVFKASRRRGRTFTYNIQINYEEWMRNAEINLLKM